MKRPTIKNMQSILESFDTRIKLYEEECGGEIDTIDAYYKGLVQSLKYAINIVEIYTKETK